MHDIASALVIDNLRLVDMLDLSAAFETIAQNQLLGLLRENKRSQDHASAKHL